MYFCCYSSLVPRMKMILLISGCLELAEMLRLFLITDWLLLPSWSKLIVVELVFLTILVFTDILMYLGVVNRRSEQFLPWLVTHFISFIVTLVFLIMHFVQIFIIISPATQNAYLRLPSGMGIRSPEFQQSFRYELGITIGKVLVLGLVVPLSGYFWILAFMGWRQVLNDSDTECERRMEERKKDETRANIYKVSGSKGYLNDPRYTTSNPSGLDARSARSLSRQTSLPRDMAEFQRTLGRQERQLSRQNSEISAVGNNMASTRSLPRRNNIEIGQISEHVQRVIPDNRSTSRAINRRDSLILALRDQEAIVEASKFREPYGGLGGLEPLGENETREQWEPREHKGFRNIKDSVEFHRNYARQGSQRSYMSQDTTFNIPSIATEFSQLSHRDFS
ncbi:uncharacterized protein LOC111700627 [Eurytemora carolleeae]|uniref:uncharacterized protein LOC111700627 n=1 Tax=Eurytemora carolleeae TaxID=1294199 RepID=UPI000C790343|nr:uncharacterized protein LOC111700627 [Eurytemora carolleeae]|eukprot:XP_023327376.1 uncharacterized protein LOC111700627 [Eurytemora affinis]